MKRLVVVALLCMPLVGCASLSGYLTPASAPQDPLDYLSITNAPKSGGFWKLRYTNKNDVEIIRQRVKDQHQRNVLSFQQTADREGLDYKIAIRQVNDAYKDASVFDESITKPTLNVGSSLALTALGLVGGWLGMKRPKDFTPEEKEKAETVAGLSDPEEFKKKISPY